MDSNEQNCESPSRLKAIRAKGGSKTGYVKTDDGGDRTEEITNSGSRGNSGNNGSYSLITPNPSEVRRFFKVRPFDGGGDGQNSEPQQVVVSSPIIIPQSTTVTETIIAQAASPVTATASVHGGEAGPFYVMMTPAQEIIAHTTPAGRRKSGVQATLVPALDPNSRGSRDEKRRATHNEVERRRRDKINNWIAKLARMVPGCNQDHTKQGQSKGGILAKTADYIQDLLEENQRLKNNQKQYDRLLSEMDSIRAQLNKEKKDNVRLRQLLERHDIPMDEDSSNANSN